MSVATPPRIEGTGENRVLLSGIPWELYVALRDNEANWHVRMTYDGGRLELMSPSGTHELINGLLRRFVEVWTEELDIPARCAGETTFRREDLKKGLEPDNCYYLENEPVIRAKKNVDLSVDPPPDLAIEVEVSSPVVSKMPIYAALEVREIWRCDGDKLRFYELGSEGHYVERERSPHFPELPPEDVTRFMDRWHEMDQTRLVKSFRQWVWETFVKQE